MDEVWLRANERGGDGVGCVCNTPLDWRAIERGEMTAMSRLGGVGRRRTAERNKPATHDESHEE
jgi:hypothetical protein